MPSSDEEPMVAATAALPSSMVTPAPPTRSAPAGASPTESEMVDWEFVTDATLWSGFGPKYAEAATSFPEHLAVEAEDPLTEFGTMEEGDLYEALEAWEFNGAKPAAGFSTRRESSSSWIRTWIRT